MLELVALEAKPGAALVALDIVDRLHGPFHDDFVAVDARAVLMRVAIHGNIRLNNEVLVLSIHFVWKELIEQLFGNGEVALLVGTQSEDTVSTFSDFGDEIACVTISAHPVPAVLDRHPAITLLATTGARIRSNVLPSCKSKHLLEVPWLIKK